MKTNAEYKSLAGEYVATVSKLTQAETSRDQLAALCVKKDEALACVRGDLKLHLTSQATVLIINSLKAVEEALALTPGGGVKEL